MYTDFLLKNSKIRAIHRRIEDIVRNNKLVPLLIKFDDNGVPSEKLSTHDMNRLVVYGFANGTYADYSFRKFKEYWLTEDGIYALLSYAKYHHAIEIKKKEQDRFSKIDTVNNGEEWQSSIQQQDGSVITVYDAAQNVAENIRNKIFENLVETC